MVCEVTDFMLKCTYIGLLGHRHARQSCRQWGAVKSYFIEADEGGMNLVRNALDAL